MSYKTKSVLSGYIGPGSIAVVVYGLILLVLLGLWALYPREWSESEYIEEDFVYYTPDSHLTYIHPELITASNVLLLVMCLGFIGLVVWVCLKGKKQVWIASGSTLIVIPCALLAFLVSLVHLMAPTPVLDEYRNAEGKVYILAYQGSLQADTAYLLGEPQQNWFRKKYPMIGRHAGPYDDRDGWIYIVRPVTVKKEQCLIPLSDGRLLGAFHNRAFMLIDTQQGRFIEEGVFQIGPFVLINEGDTINQEDLRDLEIWVGEMAANPDLSKHVYDQQISHETVIQEALAHPNIDIKNWAENMRLKLGVQATAPAAE